MLWLPRIYKKKRNSEDSVRMYPVLFVTKILLWLHLASTLAHKMKPQKPTKRIRHSFENVKTLEHATSSVRLDKQKKEEYDVIKIAKHFCFNCSAYNFEFIFQSTFKAHHNSYFIVCYVNLPRDRFDSILMHLPIYIYVYGKSGIYDIDLNRIDQCFAVLTFVEGSKLFLRTVFLHAIYFQQYCSISFTRLNNMGLTTLFNAVELLAQRF